MMTLSDGAREVAHKAFRAAKWIESQESPAGPWRERMRNAWVAYHAGAPWMSDTASAAIALRGMDADIGHLQDDNKRLRAEVERLTKERDEARSQAEELRHEAMFEVDGVALIESWSFTWDALARGDGAE